MSDPVPQAAEAVTARVALRMPGGTLRAEMTVSTGPTQLVQLLPMARALDDQIVELAVHAVEAQGRRVSCKMGCGACCRQLVPIAEVEARRIRDLVEDLPEPRRSQVRARFAEARRRLDEAGLLEPLHHTDQWGEGQSRAVGLAYFRQGIACPFLEDESCSIYPDRPLACREYLVTSPAEHCANPTPATVQGVAMPTSVWTAVARFDEPAPGAKSIRWVPLILAPEWAEAHPDEPPPRPGPELLRELIERVAKVDGLPAPSTAPPVSETP